MKNFCKLFDTQYLGQLVLIIQGDRENKPQIVLFFQPEGLGVCQEKITFKKDDEKCWDECQELFDKADINFAKKMAKQVYDVLKIPFPYELKKGKASE